MPKLGVTKPTEDEGAIPTSTPVEVELKTFEDLIPTQPIEVDGDEVRQFEADNKRVEIRVRENIPRTRICGDWYTFTKGKPQVVPAYVKQWLDEQGLL